MIEFIPREMLYTLVDNSHFVIKIGKKFSHIAPNDIMVSRENEITRVMHVSSEQNQASIQTKKIDVTLRLC